MSTAPRHKLSIAWIMLLFLPISLVASPGPALPPNGIQDSKDIKNMSDEAAIHILYWTQRYYLREFQKGLTRELSSELSIGMVTGCERAKQNDACRDDVRCETRRTDLAVAILRCLGTHGSLYIVSDINKEGDRFKKVSGCLLIPDCNQRVLSTPPSPACPRLQHPSPAAE